VRGRGDPWNTPRWPQILDTRACLGTINLWDGVGVGPTSRETAPKTDNHRRLNRIKTTTTDENEKKEISLSSWRTIISRVEDNNNPMHRRLQKKTWERKSVEFERPLTVVTLVPVGNHGGVSPQKKKKREKKKREACERNPGPER